MLTGDGVVIPPIDITIYNPPPPSSPRPRPAPSITKHYKLPPLRPHSVYLCPPRAILRYYPAYLSISIIHHLPIYTTSPRKPRPNPTTNPNRAPRREKEPISPPLQQIPHLPPRLAARPLPIPLHAPPRRNGLVRRPRLARRVSALCTWGLARAGVGRGGERDNV